MLLDRLIIKGNEIKEPGLFGRTVYVIKGNEIKEPGFLGKTVYVIKGDEIHEPGFLGKTLYVIKGNEIRTPGWFGQTVAQTKDDGTIKYNKPKAPTKKADNDDNDSQPSKQIDRPQELPVIEESLDELQQRLESEQGCVVDYSNCNPEKKTYTVPQKYKKLQAIAPALKLETIKIHAEDNYIESTEILSKLAKMGIECDRRTLYGDIDVLNDFGYEVLCEKAPGKPNKYCVVDRSFDVPELRILMDAVQASSFITPKKTEELVDKIADLGGSHRGELLRSNIVKFNTTKSTNENIFYTISEINAAIESDKKVSFEYFDFNSKHERVYRRNGKRYFVNPLATIYDDDNYYLVCYYGKYEGVVHYRRLLLFS